MTGPTGAEIQGKSDDELVNVFLPTTPNPTSGFLLFVPKRDLIPLDMSIEDGMKLVISGGIVGPAAASRTEPERWENRGDPPLEDRPRLKAV